MNIILAGPYSFPEGGSPTVRVRNFAFGLFECKANVRILAMSPIVLNSAYPLRTALDYSGITYERLAFWDLKLHGGVWGRLRWFVSYYLSVWPTYQRLKELITAGQCHLFVSYGRNAAIQWPLVKLCRRHGIPTVLDVTELAEYFSGWGGKLNPVYWDWQLGANHMPRDFDVISAITQALADKYTALGCQRVLVIPTIESWDNLSPVEPLPPRAHFHLVYVGALIDRDAPDVLLEAIRLLHGRGIPVRLDVIGRYARYSEGQRRMALMQRDPVLQACINLVGEVSDAELVERLRQADGLVLLRRDAPTEVAAFPTRLVEYLKQGRPVFVSDVGDIRTYLRHGEDALLLSPHDPVQVADTIASIASRPDRGFALGVQGRAQGAACFDRRYHAQRLLDLI